MKKIKIKVKPESLKIPAGLAVGLFLGLSLFLFFQGYQLNSEYRRQLKTELKKWKRVAQEHPEYPDSWAKLATIWYNLGEKELAKKSIKKARMLDPVREEIRKLEERINR